MWSRLVVTPVGPVDRGVLEDLISRLSRETPLDVVLGEPVSVEMDGRHQVPARDLLERLPCKDGEVVLGVTEVDLASPGRLYVFGQAAVGHGLALVSLYRLLHAHHGWSPSRELLNERSYKVALHEVGHALGLPHCGERCVMRMVSSVYQLDNLPPGFCDQCLSKLGWLPGRHSSRGRTWG